MTKVRKNYRLDPALLRSAQSALGTVTETETVEEALRRAAERKTLRRLLEGMRGKYPEFEDPFHAPAAPKRRGR